MTYPFSNKYGATIENVSVMLSHAYWACDYLPMLELKLTMLVLPEHTNETKTTRYSFFCPNFQSAQMSIIHQVTFSQTCSNRSKLWWFHDAEDLMNEDIFTE